MHVVNFKKLKYSLSSLIVLAWLMAITGFVILSSLPENTFSFEVIEVADIMEEQEESDHIEEQEFQLLTDFFSDNLPLLAFNFIFQQTNRDYLQYLNWGYGGTESPPPRTTAFC